MNRPGFKLHYILLYFTPLQKLKKKSIRHIGCRGVGRGHNKVSVEIKIISVKKKKKKRIDMANYIKTVSFTKGYQGI